MSINPTIWLAAKSLRFPMRPVLWSANIAMFIAVITLQCLSSNAMADAEHHYMIDDDNISESYWSSGLPNPSTPLYQTTLPNFFGNNDKENPKISISIQQMDEDTTPALSDDEKQKIIKPFEGDPLDRKALVIEVPIH